jgi:hypothetical protein
VKTGSGPAAVNGDEIHENHWLMAGKVWRVGRSVSQKTYLIEKGEGTR